MPDHAIEFGLLSPLLRRLQLDSLSQQSSRQFDRRIGWGWSPIHIPAPDSAMAEA
jgi:hypothetical protein